MSEHYRTLSAIFPILLRCEKGIMQILLHRRENTGYQDGRWDLSGSGHVDEGETAREAVVRECRDELGIAVCEEDVTFVHLSHRLSADKIYYDLYFKVGKYSGSPSIAEPEKSSALTWFDIDNLPEDIIAVRKADLENVRNGIFYSEKRDT